jgi:hypothetical protein
MVKPVQPSNPTGGDGSEKYTPPKEKFVPSEYDKTAEKVKQENDKAKADARKIAEEHRAKVEAERPRTYTERLQDMGRLPKPSGGAGGDFSGMKGLDKPFKTGGKVSEASHKKALEKAGFYDKGKTKSEREKIVSKVTTKSQRLGMVEKLFSAKKMKSGGMASKRADGCAIRGKTKGKIL